VDSWAYAAAARPGKSSTTSTTGHGDEVREASNRGGFPIILVSKFTDHTSVIGLVAFLPAADVGGDQIHFAGVGATTIHDR